MESMPGFSKLTDQVLFELIFVEAWESGCHAVLRLVIALNNIVHKNNMQQLLKQQKQSMNIKQHEYTRKAPVKSKYLCLA